MHVDPNYITNLSSALDQSQASEQQLTAELSSGVRVTSLSQDPVSSGENVLLLNQIQQDDSFTQSSSLVTGQSSGRRLGPWQRRRAAHAGHFAGHQRQQRHHECERREVHRQSDLRHSRRGAIAGQHQLSGPVHLCRRPDVDRSVHHLHSHLARPSPPTAATKTSTICRCPTARKSS